MVIDSFSIYAFNITYLKFLSKQRKDNANRAKYKKSTNKSGEGVAFCPFMCVFVVNREDSWHSS